MSLPVPHSTSPPAAGSGLPCLNPRRGAAGTHVTVGVSGWTTVQVPGVPAGHCQVQSPVSPGRGGGQRVTLWCLQGRIRRETAHPAELCWKTGNTALVPFASCSCLVAHSGGREECAERLQLCVLQESHRTGLWGARLSSYSSEVITLPRAPPSELPPPPKGGPSFIFTALSQANRSETQYPCS